MLWKPCCDARAFLADVEDLALGLVEDLRDRPALRVEGGGRDLVARRDQLAQDRALAHDLGVAADVGGARHALRQRVQVDEAAALVGLAEALQLLEDGDHVGRLGRVDQRRRSPRRSAGARSGRSRCRSSRSPTRSQAPLSSSRPPSTLCSASTECGGTRSRATSSSGRTRGEARRTRRRQTSATIISAHACGARRGQRCGQPVDAAVETAAANEKGPAKAGPSSRSQTATPSGRVSPSTTTLTSTTTSVCGATRHRVLADGLQRAVRHAHLRLRDLEVDARSAHRRCRRW